MTWDWSVSYGWLLRSALGGGLLLLVVWCVMPAIRQPAKRQAWGQWGILAALVLAVLCWYPPWLPLPGSWFMILPPLPQAAMPTPPAAKASESPSGLPSLLVPPETVGGRLQDGGWRESGGIALNSNNDNHIAPVKEIATAATALPITQADPSPDQADQTRRAPLAGEDVSRWLLTAYAGIAGFLLLRWLAGFVIVWRVIHAGIQPPGGLLELFDTLCRDMPKKPRLLVSASVRVPISCGVFRHTVVIPPSMCSRGRAEELTCVFVHELTHVRRRDGWSGLLLGLGLVVYFFCPWFWWLRRQVRLCQEYIADAAAVSRAASPEDYAQFLLSLTSMPAVPAQATGVSGKTSDLFRRVTMLLHDSGSVSPRCPRWWSVGSALALLALAALVAGVGRQAQAQASPIADEPQTVVSELSADDPHTVAAAATNQTCKEMEIAQQEVKKAEDQVNQLRQKLNRLIEIENGLFQDKLQRNAIKTLRASGLIRSNDIELPKNPGEGRLGVQVDQLSEAMADQLEIPKGRGLLINRVISESAAAKAGLKPHDILVEFNGKPIGDNPEDLVKMVREIKAKTPFEAVVVRKGKKETIKGIVLGEAKKVKSEDPTATRIEAWRALGQATKANEEKGRWNFANGDRNVMTTITRTDNRFTARYQEGTLMITLTGGVSADQATAKEIHVQDGVSEKKYESVDKVPDRYRDKVKSLLEMTEKGSVKIEIKKP